MLKIRSLGRNESLMEIDKRYRYKELIRITNRLIVIVSDKPFRLSGRNIIGIVEEQRIPIYKVELNYRMNGVYKEKEEVVLHRRYNIVGIDSIRNRAMRYPVYDVVSI